MFTIKGKTELKQWEQNVYLVNPDMNVGDTVRFVNGSGAVCLMYAYKDGNDVVVEVPNILLQDDRTIVIDLIDDINDFFRFDIVAQSKPVDYVYINNIKRKDVEDDSSGGGDSEAMEAEAMFVAYIEATVTDLRLPSSLTKIAGRVFNSNLTLKSIYVPSGVTTVESNAFYQCSKLEKVTFEGTPDSIAGNAFAYCTKMNTINVPWAEGAVANAPWGATNATINYNYTGK